MKRALALALLGTALAAASPAAASPVAADEASYLALGRVFPDPLAGCQNAGTSPCDPNAQGNVPAGQFINFIEFVEGLKYMNSKPEWRRYLEVLVLDGKIDPIPGNIVGPNLSATKAQVEADPQTMFPGNNLANLEFSPHPKYLSAGLPTTGTGRKKSDLIVVRVTDENVPDAGKKRYALSLSIHGIERAGAEGGTRAMEDMVTAVTSGRLDEPILPPEARAGRPVATFKEALEKSIVYFTYPNPDGWRRGSVTEGGVFFQRYNGNGIDPNRDWADIGYSFRGYSGYSEPETRALKAFFDEQIAAGRTFQAGDDLHGQPHADALSYTLMPHGRHDFGKDLRIREAAKTINRAQFFGLKWSPYIVENADHNGPNPGAKPGTCAPTLSETCTRIYAQTWGSVYDTINYTTTGTLGDWFDSSVGANADGIDNEMSFSHLDKNIVFDPHTEQLHVAGNKAIIFAHLAELIDPPADKFAAKGRKGYVANRRVVQGERVTFAGAPANTVAQANISDQQVIAPPGSTTLTFPFTVQRTAPSGGNPGVFSGGMRVDVAVANVQGISTNTARLSVQCRYCDDHVGVPAADAEWVTVAEDFNQAAGVGVTYYQAGLTAAINKPQALSRTGRKIEWRAVVTNAAAGRFDVDFTSGPATADGASKGDTAPRLAAYNVANTDFFEDLNGFITDPDERLQEIDPRAVITGSASLADLDTLVLSDDPLPGYTGFYRGQGSVQPSDTGLYTPAEKNAWVQALRNWTAAGGTLVLTDAALRFLPELTSVPLSAVNRQQVYVGQNAFSFASGTNTLSDPLARDVAQFGARFGSGMRRQTFEPVGIGYAIQNATGGDFAGSRQYDIAKSTWEQAGGRSVAASATNGTRNASAVLTRITVGEIPLGDGRIRVEGALLPQPTEANDHPLGLEPYAVTYTGYILARNLLDAPRAGGQPSQALTATASGICRDRSAPQVFIEQRSVRLQARGLEVRGAATDKGCGRTAGRVARVEVALARLHANGRCKFITSDLRLSRLHSCRNPVWQRAVGRTQWGFATERLLPRGRYRVLVRAVDAAGNAGRPARSRRVVR